MIDFVVDLVEERVDLDGSQFSESILERRYSARASQRECGCPGIRKSMSASLRSARKSARPSQSQGRKERRNRVGVETEALRLGSRERMCGTTRPTLLTKMGSEEQRREGQSTTGCWRNQESQNLRIKKSKPSDVFLQCHQWRV